MIKLSVDVNRKIGEAGTFGSRGAGCAFSEIEIDEALLANPAALAAWIRKWFELAETATDQELARLNGATAHRPTQVAGPASNTPPPTGPSTNGNARAAVPSPTQAQANAQAAEEDEEDAPQNGSQLLGWARKQSPDAMGWIIGYGKKRQFNGRVVDWNPAQVGQAFLACKKTQRRS